MKHVLWALFLLASLSQTFAQTPGNLNGPSTGGSRQITPADINNQLANKTDYPPPVASTTTSGTVKVDGTTITVTGGVASAVGGSATSVIPGTTTVSGGGAPCFLENTTSTTLGCTALGTGVPAALGVNIGSAGAPVLLGGAGGTPSSLTGTNITGTATGLTAGVANGLNSASTTVVVNAATAPTAGQALVATSGTAAHWATISGGSGCVPSGSAGELLTDSGSGTCTDNTTGTGALTALGINVGSAGAFVTNGGALGTPSSGTATNLSGTAASLTAGTATAANGLKSATTTVSVSAATAPSTGQVLTATDSTHATWQTGGGSGITVKDGVPNTVSGTTQATFGNGFVVGGTTPNATVSLTLPNRTVTASPTILSTDMNGIIYSNVSGGGTLTIPAIVSNTLLDNGMTVAVTNYSASTEAVSTTPTVNSGGGCVTGTGIPSKSTWVLTGNGTTVDCIQTVSSASAASSITPGTTTIVGSTAPCIIENSTSTTMACAAVTAGNVTALGVSTGSAGAPVLFNGAGGTPSSMTGTNITGIPNAAVAAAPLPTPGSGATLAAPRSYYVCTTTCTITLPTPAAGYEFCARNDNNVSTVITFAAITGVQFENTSFTSYKTANTSIVSAGAAGDKLCVLGRDSTHYLVMSFNGTWS